MTTNEPERAELLTTLREQTSELLQQVPGPLRKVSVSAGDSTVTVEWADRGGQPAPQDSGPEPQAQPGAQPGARPPDGAADLDGGVQVTAPLVGTFYRAPEPGADPFVEVGDLVDADQTVAIVEAMKLMNPVKAPQAGEIVAIHVEDADMVEFAQPLLTIAPKDE